MATLTPQRRPTERKRSSARRQEYQQSSEGIVRVERWTPARRTSWIKVVSLITSLACIGGLLFFFLDDRFYITEAEITGNSLLSAEEILSGTGCANWNVFWVDDRQVKANLSAIPTIRNVRVRSGLPARLIIDVEERVPQIVWQASNGRFLVDDAGKVLKRTDEIEDMIVIRDRDGANLKPGQTLPIANAIESAQVLQALLGDIRLFGYTAEKGIILDSHEGYQVYFGEGGDLALKVAISDALVAEVARSQVSVEYIDVRFVESPVYGVSR